MSRQYLPCLLGDVRHSDYPLSQLVRKDGCACHSQWQRGYRKAESLEFGSLRYKSDSVDVFNIGCAYRRVRC